MPIAYSTYIIVHDVSDAKKMPCRMGQMSQMSRVAHPEIVGGGSCCQLPATVNGTKELAFRKGAAASCVISIHRREYPLP